MGRILVYCIHFSFNILCAVPAVRDHGTCIPCNVTLENVSTGSSLSCGGLGLQIVRCTRCWRVNSCLSAWVVYPLYIKQYIFRTILSDYIITSIRRAGLAVVLGLGRRKYARLQPPMDKNVNISRKTLHFCFPAAIFGFSAWVSIVAGMSFKRPLFGRNRRKNMLFRP